MLHRLWRPPPEFADGRGGVRDAQENGVVDRWSGSRAFECAGLDRHLWSVDLGQSGDGAGEE
jgi:hypothetical protein